MNRLKKDTRIQKTRYWNRLEIVNRCKILKLTCILVHSYIKCDGIFWYIWRSFKNTSLVQSINVCQITTNIINCAQERASLITKQELVKKKMFNYFNIDVTQAKWIQSVLKAMFKFALVQMILPRCNLVRNLTLAIVTIKNTGWRQSNIL